MQHHYELNSTVLKTNEPLSLWKNDRGSVDIGKDTLAVAIMLEGKPEGYIFSGNGKMILDAIVETDQGAVGKSIEKQLQEPFLMVGKPENPESHSFLTADSEQNDFLTKAQYLFHKFFGREHFKWGYNCHHRADGLIFAFSNDSGKLDHLILRGPKIVYKAGRMVFISNENEAILKSPEQMVVSNHGRCIIMN
jgi:hypothetical protein